MTDEIRELKSTTAAEARPLPQRTPSSDCLETSAGERYVSGEIAVGHEELNGHRTIKVAHNRALTWYSLEVGCALIKRRHEFDLGYGVQELVFLYPGEPDPALLQVPERFREVAPSQMLFQRAGSKDLAVRDSYYHANRPK